MRAITSGELAKLREIELEILLEIKRVCTEMGIQFFIESGTLLGAARHGGFIPWDDDIDIGMLREDYKRFLREAPDLLGSGYFLDDPATNSNSLVSFAKVRKHGTLLLEHAASGIGGCQGIWVDVFPWDYVAGEERLFVRTQRRWKFRHKLYGLRSVSVAQSDASPTKRGVRKLAHWTTCVLPKSVYGKILEETAIAPLEQGTTSITCVHYFTALPNIKYADAFPLTTLPFESHEMPAFRCWENYLEQVYGDWRALPPEEKRRRHDIADLSFDESSGE